MASAGEGEARAPFARALDAFFVRLGSDPWLYLPALAALTMLVLGDLFLSRALIDAGVAIEGNPVARPLVEDLRLGVAVKVLVLLGFVAAARKVPARIVGLCLSVLLTVYAGVNVHNVATVL